MTDNNSIGDAEKNKYGNELIMTVGDKIRYYRELNGMTRKELGLRAGFSDKTAAIRISQYENKVSIPKSDIRSKLAAALNVDISALVDINIADETALMQVLFELRDRLNLKIEKDGSDFILRFSNLAVQNLRLKKHFEAWLDKQEQFDLGACSKKEYDLWCVEFPNVAEVNINEEDLKVQLEKMQKELEIQLKKTKQEVEQKATLLKELKKQIHR